MACEFFVAARCSVVLARVDVREAGVSVGFFAGLLVASLVSRVARCPAPWLTVALFAFAVVAESLRRFA